MSDYDFKPGGSLKLKGGIDGGLNKKKKKKSTLSQSSAKLPAEQADSGVKSSTSHGTITSTSHSSSSRASPSDVLSSGGSSDKKTDAEKRFEQIQKERLAKRVAKLASKTHKERVSDFNAKLEALSEHHDIPKVGPG